jgi:hypothetical protein
MRIAPVVSLAVALAACALSPSQAGDAIASRNTGSVSLGKNWGPYETFRGSSFRWVDNDAEIVVRRSAEEAHVGIACEGGPSLRRRTFALRVLDTTRRQVDHVVCDGPDRRQELLLPAGGDTRYVLHVDGGGKRVSGDPRVLNFRVFYLDDVHGALAGDVVEPGSGVRIGAGWYPVEHFNGQTFRWMRNDARLVISSDRGRRATLNMLLEPGPSIGSRAAALTIRDGRGRILLRTTLGARVAVTVPLQLQRGDNDVVIGVTSRNSPVSGERRILNVRLFSAALQQ